MAELELTRAPNDRRLYALEGVGTLALRPASAWRESYALADGDRELAILAGKSWGRRPVKVSVDDLDVLEPGLLLFATFVVRGLAEDAGSAAAGAGASTAATGSY